MQLLGRIPFPLDIFYLFVGMFVFVQFLMVARNTKSSFNPQLPKRTKLIYLLAMAPGTSLMSMLLFMGLLGVSPDDNNGAAWSVWALSWIASVFIQVLAALILAVAVFVSLKLNKNRSGLTQSAAVLFFTVYSLGACFINHPGFE